MFVHSASDFGGRHVTQRDENCHYLTARDETGLNHCYCGAIRWHKDCRGSLTCGQTNWFLNQLWTGTGPVPEGPPGLRSSRSLQWILNTHTTHTHFITVILIYYFNTFSQGTVETICICRLSHNWSRSEKSLFYWTNALYSWMNPAWLTKL